MAEAKDSENGKEGKEPCASAGTRNLACFAMDIHRRNLGNYGYDTRQQLLDEGKLDRPWKTSNSSNDR